MIDTSRTIGEVVETMDDTQKRALKDALRFASGEKEKIKATSIKTIETMDGTQKRVTYALIGMMIGG